MHDELFEKLDIVARYRAGPDVEARERFLRQASAEGHSRSTLKRIAWALLFVAEAVQSHGGSISSTQLIQSPCIVPSHARRESYSPRRVKHEVYLLMYRLISARTRFGYSKFLSGLQLNIAKYANVARLVDGALHQ